MIPDLSALLRLIPERSGIKGKDIHTLSLFSFKSSVLISCLSSLLKPSLIMIQHFPFP